jgi:hypothetical protein
MAAIATAVAEVTPETKPEEPKTAPTPEVPKVEAPKPEVKPEAPKSETTAKKETLITKAQEPVAPKAPEKYDLKLPANSLLDDSAIERTAAYAKAQGLSNDAAQKLIEQQNESVVSHVEKRREMWRQAVEADKEIGGNSQRESVEMAKRVVDRFGTEAFKAELNTWGFGNHPELVRILARIGKSMGDDKLILQGTQKQPSKTVEDLFYGKKQEEEN